MMARSKHQTCDKACQEACVDWGVAEFQRPCFLSDTLTDTTVVKAFSPHLTVFNRPGIAGGVLHTPLWFINSLIYFPFIDWVILSIPNHTSGGAEVLRECSPLTMCHISLVPCHVSRVKFVSILFFWTKWGSQSGEGLLSTAPTPSSFSVDSEMVKYKVFSQQRVTVFNSELLIRHCTALHCTGEFFCISILKDCGVFTN